MPGFVLTIVICQTPPSVYGAVLWVVEVVVTAADAEFCAEQMPTVPAAAVIMIAVLNIFVNFILIVFLVLVIPGLIETEIILGRDL
jgi:hypothetical protein